MSEAYCDVSLEEYDGDSATFYDEQHVKARKPHVCYECHEDITAGAHYHRVVGKWDDEVRTYKFCEACWEVMGEFSSDGTRTFGITWDTFDSEWNDGATLQGCLNRLTSVAAKELMTRKYRKSKGLDVLAGDPPPETT